MRKFILLVLFILLLVMVIKANQKPEFIKTNEYLYQQCSLMNDTSLCD